MGSLVRSVGIILLTSLFTLLFGFSSVLGQDLREQDALCNADGCFVVYFQRKTFLESWRACKEKGGNLATIKRKQDATSIATLFSTVDLRNSYTEVRVWIGLQRQPRQCVATRPLRGFSWTTGDQDTEYTNWMKEDSPNMCSVPRCVVMGYSTKEQSENFKWLDGSCSVPVDGYLCHYTYKGMCHALWSEGAGNALYTTPFNLVTTLQRYLPFGSVATMPCPSGAKEEQSVLCMLKEGGSVGWSREQPFCSEPSVAHNWCSQNNGGCEHYCRTAGDHSYCECADGYQLGEDGQSCELSDVCQKAPCEFECVPLSDSYRCACPDGYMLAPNERDCIDVDECLQSPCEQLCENLPGTFECQCRSGYHPDHMGGCEDIDECIDDPCEHACENTLGSHICHCHLGYSSVPEDPSQCQDIDECQIPGTCEQMCVNYDGGFECYCEEGFELGSDQSSCQKRVEGDDQAAVTHQTGLVWGPEDYDWNAEQSHTEWPTEEEQSLDWLTDPPQVLNQDVIWVTSAPQEELPIESELGPLIPGAEKDEGGIRPEWLEWWHTSQSEPNILSTSTYTTSPPTTYSTTPDWYGDEEEEEEEEATTARPFLSTSTISEGAWNWWAELATSSQNPGNPEDLVTDHNTPTDSSNHSTQKEEEDILRENSQYTEELGGGKKDPVEIVQSQGLTVPTQFTASQPPLNEGGVSGDIPDSVQEDRGQKQSSTWLLVGLLVPICIFIVVMVALGIVYCTRCAVQPRNKNATDCYHWISGAHDKQGAPNQSAGVKTHV